MDLTGAVRSVEHGLSTVRRELELIALDGKKTNNQRAEFSTHDIIEVYSLFYDAITSYEQRVKDNEQFGLDAKDAASVRRILGYGKNDDSHILAESENARKSLVDCYEKNKAHLDQTRRKLIKRFEAIELQAGYHFLSRSMSTTELDAMKPEEVKTKYRKAISQDDNAEFIVYRNVRNNAYAMMTLLGMIPKSG